MTKPTILMIPSWYPTKENPFNGCFFREQALAMKDHFDFVVLTYKAKKIPSLLYWMLTLVGAAKPRLTFVQDDEGMKEYSLRTFESQPIVWDLFLDRFNMIVRHEKLPEGVGQKEWSGRQKARYRNIKRLQKTGALPQFDCVYSLTAQNMAPIGHDFARIYGVPHVTAEHAPFPWPGHVILDTAKEGIENADAFLAISNDKIRQVLLQNIKVNPIWVGNLCDETKFSLSSEAHDVPTFLIVAANSFFKNYPLFIKTMEELKRIATKDFRIVIAGYGSNKGYSKNSKELEDMVHNSTIAENTRMIGSVSRADMPALYNSVDVFVMTSIQEGLPVSALEASMSGLPVFSTRCGGVEDYVDETMGRIFDIADYRGIAEACNAYLEGEISFDRNAIREKAVSLFGTEAFVSRMNAIFSKVLLTP